MNRTARLFMTTLFFVNCAFADQIFQWCAGWNDGVCIRRYLTATQAIGLSLNPIFNSQMSKLWSPSDSTYVKSSDNYFRLNVELHYLYEKELFSRLYAGPLIAANYALYVPYDKNDFEMSGLAALRVSYRCNSRISFETSVGGILQYHFRNYPSLYNKNNENTTVDFSAADNIVTNIGIFLYF